MVRKVKGVARRAKATAEPALSGVSASDLNALLMSIARLPPDSGDDASDRAQEIAFEAMEARTARKRIGLAQEALALSPSCSDAYLVLAREASHADDALDLYRRAEAAGVEGLGQAPFKEDVGLFWSLIGTRPYMRAPRTRLGSVADGRPRRSRRPLPGTATPLTE